VTSFHDEVGRSSFGVPAGSANDPDTSDRDVLPLILDNLAEGVFTLDSDWRFTSYNKAAEDLTGYTREQAIGRHCFELLKSTRCGDSCPVRLAIKTGQTQRNQLISVRHRRGHRVWLCVSANAMRDEGGSIIGGLQLLRAARCVEDACCDTAAEGKVHDCEHAEQAANIREAARGYSRPSQRAILAAELAPEPPDARLPEAEKLANVLQANGWNRQRTAELLGISRSTLWRRMKEYGLID